MSCVITLYHQLIFNKFHLWRIGVANLNHFDFTQAFLSSKKKILVPEETNKRVFIPTSSKPTVR